MTVVHLQASKLMDKFIDIFVCITETLIDTASMPNSYINVIINVYLYVFTCKHNIYNWNTPGFYVHVTALFGRTTNLLITRTSGYGS